MKSDFCTCRDYKCALNPANHGEGCDPCIRKNLKKGEIPTCFFKMVNEDISNVEKFDVHGFVKHYNSAVKASGEDADFNN